MAVGGLMADDHVSRGSNGQITAAVMVTCIVAASGGLIFGYDIGISGGVTTMVPFQHKFFPSVLRKEASAKTSLYCVYDNQVLTAFTSSLYIAGLPASLVASRLATNFGRKLTIVLGGCTFLLGASINAGAQNIVMLIFGRIFLGFGVGFTNQAAPIYLSEVAPRQWRGAFTTSFEFFNGIGIVSANCINYSTTKLRWGWRLSLGLAIIPAMIMTLGALMISDSPSSLVDRGKFDQAKVSLEKVRGESDVEVELAELIKVSQAARTVATQPFITIFQRQYRPHLVMAILIPLFQQLTGVNAIAFFAPVLFQSVGFSSDSALLAAIILSLVNLVANFTSTLVVDRFGRRFLFLVGGAQMFICQVAVAIILGVTADSPGEKHISREYAILVLVLISIYAAGFGWSWGPLFFLVPSEIFPLKLRPTGQSITIALNLAITFVLSQTFLSMLCHFRYGAFLFYAAWIAIMTIFIALFLPETKGTPLDSMDVWKKHWYWHRFMPDEA
ncbi:hypothetical protein Droror1_Dr00011305 [Drosera rotundifolia]